MSSFVAIFSSICFVRFSINCAKSSMVIFFVIVYLLLQVHPIKNNRHQQVVCQQASRVAAGASNCAAIAGVGVEMRFFPLGMVSGRGGRDVGLWSDGWGKQMKHRSRGI